LVIQNGNESSLYSGSNTIPLSNATSTHSIKSAAYVLPPICHLLPPNQSSASEISPVFAIE